ncbi:LOB domain-containing protein 9-like [Trifolium pratense]|uniref:LOB domain-containing protein 9-like n=1 Tax=Trifolium pratense TaxID=57577 RepID=UPI001E698307|nr:LOB domain-containing protein 9-like [Trifolium pratense]
MSRRCPPDCEFGQYFPANRNEDFQKAIKLFGLSHILRIMRSVEPNERQAAADSILFEGSVWRFYPQSGLLRYELELVNTISSSLRELQIANQLLAFFKNHANERPAGDMSGISTIREKGESSNASKGKEGVEDGEKGKGIIIEQDESEDSDEEEGPKKKCRI